MHELSVGVLSTLSASFPWFMEEVGHQQKKHGRNTPQDTNKMKSDVSDVGSHVLMYTNIIHHGLNGRTPVTTACHFARGTLDKSASSPEAAQGLARGKDNRLS